MGLTTYSYMFSGEKWPHEQGEMEVNIPYMTYFVLFL